MAEVVLEGVGVPISNDSGVVPGGVGTPLNNNSGVVPGAVGPPLNNDFFPGFGAGEPLPFPGFGAAPPKVGSAGAAGSTGLASDAGHTHKSPVIYVEGSGNSSIQSNRGAQSSSDATAPGITNFGSLSFGSAGVFSAYATCGGGDRNNIPGGAPYAVIPGGIGAVASREGQAARASGSFAIQGDAQIGDVILGAESIGGAITELTSLALGGQFTIETLKSYKVTINAVATRTNVDEGGTKSASTTRTLLVRRATGGSVQILTGAVPTAFTEDPEATGWLFLVDAASAPNRVRLRIDPNGDTATIRIVSNVSWNEVGKSDT